MAKKARQVAKLRALSRCSYLQRLRHRLAEDLLLEVTPDEFAAFMLVRHQGSLIHATVALQVCCSVHLEWLQLRMEIGWEFGATPHPFEEY